MKRLFFITAIITISLFTLYPTFSLALLGDDWLAFQRYLQHLGPRSSGEWNHLSYFLTPYGAQDIMMGFLQKIFGYSSTWYYFISFILRLVAAFSLYPLLFYLTKNNLATFFAILFFSITIIGFDTTNWSSNMTTYITIALFNLSLYFLIRSQQEKPIKFFILFAVLYYLAYITTPIRMHGSLPFIFLLELFYVYQERKYKVLKIFGIRLGIILLIFLLIRFTGHSQGPPEEITQRFNLGLTTIATMLQQGDFKFILNPITILGNMVIPDFIIRSSNLFLSILIGIIILATTIFLTIKFFKKKNLSTALFLGLSWSILSFFFAWWWVPKTIFPTTYRYLIVSAVGICILFASIISLGKKKKQQLILFVFFSLILLIHVISSRIYINYLLNTHGQQISDKIWSSIPKIDDIGKTKEPIIFYFEGNGTNDAIIHDSITFGFPPRMALMYNLREEDGGLPIPMNNWQEVISATIDGKTLPAYGYPIKAVSLDHIYAFYLNGKDDLVNITDLAREKLKQIRSQSNQ